MQEEGRRVIIIFPDPWLSYSPTVINASKLLSEHFPVIILTIGKEKYLGSTFTHEENVDVQFIDSENLLFIRILRKIDWVLNIMFSYIFKIKPLNTATMNELFIGNNFENIRNVYRFRSKLRSMHRNNDIVIGVDSMGMVAAAAVGRKFHSLSLEIGKNLFYYFINWSKVQCLIVQTAERKAHFVKAKWQGIKTYFVQNAPFVNPAISKINKVNNFRIIYLGSLAINYNALQAIADSLQYLPPEFTIVFKGPRNINSENFFKKHYPQYMNSGRLKFDSTYISNEALPAYLDDFSIGITLYNIDSLPYKNFNVISCPSGKLFNYYNSGLPVVGNNIVGLRSIDDLKTGRLIDKLDGKNIARAVLEVSGNYIHFSNNAKSAAELFDFRKSMNAFIFSELDVPTRIGL